MISLPEFETMVSDHGPALYRLAVRLVGSRDLAEDIVQDTFASAWRSRASYKETHNPRSWFCAILRRRAADMWRRPRFPEVGLDADVLVNDVPRDLFSDPVQDALDTLPPVLRQAILLVAVGELTHQEAADAEGVTVGTMLSRVSRARTQLRLLLLKKLRVA